MAAPFFIFHFLANPKTFYHELQRKDLLICCAYLVNTHCSEFFYVRPANKSVPAQHPGFQVGNDRAHDTSDLLFL